MDNPQKSRMNMPLSLSGSKLSKTNLPDSFYSNEKSTPYHQRRYQKDAGAYYTDQNLAEVLAEIALENLVEPLVAELRDAVEKGAEDEIREHLQEILGLKICDPMVGEGVFLSKLAPQMEKVLSEMRSAILESGINLESTELKNEQELFEHLYSSMLYGVDLDGRALGNTVTHIAENASLDEEDIQRLIAPNLKQGNALLDPVSPDNWPNRQTLHFPEKLGKLVLLRKQLKRGNHESVTISELIELKEELFFRTAGPVLEEFPDWYLDDDQPFCWPLEFPELFYDDQGRLLDSHGFDLVIGNPPWDVVKYNDREFFDAIEPGYSQKSRSEQDETKEELLRDSEIESQYNKYVERIEVFLDFVKSDIYYKHQTSGRYGHSYNKYKLATELAFNIASDGGEVVLITPAGIMGEAGSTALRSLLFDHSSVDSFWSFKARADVFKGVDQNPAIQIYSKGGNTDKFRCVDGLQSVEEFRQLYHSDEIPYISGELVRDAAPETFSLIPVRNPRALRVLETITDHPLASDESDGHWSVTPSREIDETNHRHHIVDEETSYPFVKGRCVFPLDLQPDIVGRWVNEEFLENECEHYDQSRVVWRDIARPSLRRRMFVTIVPPYHGIGNSLNYVVPDQPEPVKVYLAAVMQSWVFEYRARQISTNSHLNMYVIRQVPVPRLETHTELFDKIVSQTRDILNEEVDDEVRKSVMNRIDALVARAYGLDGDELEFILDSFEKLEAETKQSILNAHEGCEGIMSKVMVDD